MGFVIRSRGQKLYVAHGSFGLGIPLTVKQRVARRWETKIQARIALRRTRAEAFADAVLVRIVPRAKVG